MTNTNKTRVYQLAAGLVACHLVPAYGAGISAPPALVLSCYFVALVATFGADWLIYEVTP